MIVASFYASRFEKWDCDYDKLLLLLDKSCKKLGLKHYCISDSPRTVDTFQCSLPENLMEAILDGQRQFLERSRGQVLLVGADCLIREVFEIETPHMVITTHDGFSDCRMNTGAIWCCGKECAPIWQQALKYNLKDWGDDQIGLYRAVCNSNLVIEEVPCEQYNWAPEDVDDPCPSAVIHFRGSRKQFMPEWAEKHLGIKI